MHTNQTLKSYRGRFAPSPSGELHFGSLLAAMASYADARAHQGQWLLRIDDIDQVRVVPDSEQHIINSLEQAGFEWDEPVYYQSQHIADYQQALGNLTAGGLIYPCYCSRKQIKALARDNIYPGICRETAIPDESADEYALRIRVPEQNLSFNDLIQGHYCQQLDKEVGDFIIFRRDKVFTYQLAIVVDEYLAGISHVIRGHDLISSTPRQMFLQQQLGFATPRYGHIPLAVTPDNLKLSKLSHAKKVTTDLTTLVLAARILGQAVLKAEDYQHQQDFWKHLFQIWQLKQVPKMEKIEIMY